MPAILVKIFSSEYDLPSLIVASLGVVVAIVIGLLQIFKKDKHKEQQTESQRLIAENLKKANELKEYSISQNKINRAIDSKPIFIISSPANGKGNYEYTLKCTKNNAKYIKIENNTSDVFSTLRIPENTFINEGELLFVSVGNLQQKEHLDYLCIIDIEDIDNNPYKLTIKGHFGNYSILQLTSIDVL